MYNNKFFKALFKAFFREFALEIGAISALIFSYGLHMAIFKSWPDGLALIAISVFLIGRLLWGFQKDN